MNTTTPIEPDADEVRAALLVLSDGTTFEGEAAGARPPGGIAGGVIVADTAMTGYQEVLTDPSSAGTIVTFTYPTIGNVGVNPDGAESRGAWVRGVVVRELSATMSSWRATATLHDFLAEHAIPAITGVDTRRLTRHVRGNGPVTAVFGVVDDRVEGHVTEADLRRALDEPGATVDPDPVSRVTAAEPYRLDDASGTGRRIVVLDLGATRSLLRRLTRVGAVEVVPASTAAAAILDRSPDGVVLSNGPGDPRGRPDLVATADALIGRVPVLGIGLGTELLAIARGATVTELPTGHHGASRPVREVATGAVGMTVQNHRFTIAPDGLGDCTVTHLDLDDGTVEGIEVPGARAFGVLYHPEADPGPRDDVALFTRFEHAMKEATV